MDKICGICGKATDETMLTVDNHETACLECATKTAKEAQTEKRHIEIYDEHWNNWFLCTWCEELFPESELREEADLGALRRRSSGVFGKNGRRMPARRIAGRFRGNSGCR